MNLNVTRMVNHASARAALRSATARCHERVDQIFSRADLKSREGLADFLSAQAGAHFPAERALDDAGAAAIVPDWASARRSPKLAADLAALGRGPPSIDFDI